MQNLFKEKYRQAGETLEQNGFIIIDFLNTEQLLEFRNVYEFYKTEIDDLTHNGIHMTTWTKKNETKFCIKNKLQGILKEPCNQIFEDYKLLNTVFIVKNKHKMSDFPLHQDWSFIDETKHPAINIWIALQDTTIQNGGLYIISGSHKLRNNIRGPGKLSFDFTPYKKALRKYLVPVHLKKGQAILFYYSMIHGSPPNNTRQPRIIVAASVVPANAGLVLNYFDEENNTLSRYKMEDDFIYQYDDIHRESVSGKPAGILLESIKNYPLPNISLQDITNIAIRKETSMIHRIFSYLKEQFSVPDKKINYNAKENT